MQIFNCEQGTPEWKELRCGVITASDMSKVLAKGQGKTRLSYMYKLIGEAMTGEPADGFSNQHMDRGHLMEPAARELYAEQTGNTIEQVGFILNHGVGYSPDALVNDDGLGEIKSKLPHLMAELWDRGKVPGDHVAQIQCGLWVSEREWLDFVAYWPGIPLFVKRVYRDDLYIKNMEADVRRFYDEMAEKMAKIQEAA